MIVFEKRFSRTAFDYINVFSAYFSVPSISLKIIYIKGRLFEYLQKKTGGRSACESNEKPFQVCGTFLSHPEAKKKMQEGRETSINKEEKARKTPHISLHFLILK